MVLISVLCAIELSHKQHTK